MLKLVERLTQEIPCYELRFDRSGETVHVLGEI
jgi:hypothetical protein